MTGPIHAPDEVVDFRNDRQPQGSHPNGPVQAPHRTLRNLGAVMPSQGIPLRQLPPDLTPTSPVPTATAGAKVPSVSPAHQVPQAPSAAACAGSAS